ncbi:MAG TPA: hypothetical protein VK683_08805 [Rhizomicrobium sp.]|jgi:hypothetical protein|nr:hypothetical protein [Rhizomicrobium sp.]
MMTRKIVRLLIASGTVLFGLSYTDARAAVTEPKQHAQATHKEDVKAAKKAVRTQKRTPRPSLIIVSKAPNDAPDFDYQDRVQEAQALVAKQPVLKDDMQFDKEGNLSHFVWTLAIGQKSGPLTVIRMDETGKNDQGLVITWPVDNFINTRFRVSMPEGTIVFAQRRPVRTKDSYQEAVYTAYSPELDTKTMRTAGMDYLRHLQRLAYDRIKDHDVRSHVAPNLTVADKIPTSTVLRLMITEHIDPLHMKYVGIEQCVHEVLVTIAANREHAYAYAKSSAGARGLPQFMEDSYEMVRENYPKALLEPDFERGMSDLHNAILASVLLLDLELTQLPRDFLRRFSDSSQQVASFLAAGYNRNPAHVVQTYHRTHSFTGGNAPFQNKMYVRIQNWVGGFLKREYDVT